MLVRLTYFKQSGKYYSEGQYITKKKKLFEIWDEIVLLMQVGELPGLMKGHSDFIV